MADLTPEEQQQQQQPQQQQWREEPWQVFAGSRDAEALPTPRCTSMPSPTINLPARMIPALFADDDSDALLSGRKHYFRRNDDKLTVIDARYTGKESPPDSGHGKAFGGLM